MLVGGFKIETEQFYNTIGHELNQAERVSIRES